MEQRHFAAQLFDSFGERAAHAFLGGWMYVPHTGQNFFDFTGELQFGQRSNNGRLI